MRFNSWRMRAALSICTTLMIPPAASLGAQSTPSTTTVQPKPAMTPVVHQMTQPRSSPNPQMNEPLGTMVSLLPAPGMYILTLSATKVNGRPAPSTQVLSRAVTVGWSGAAVSIAGSGITLTGNVTNNHLAVSSSAADGSLSLSGTPAAHSASGTFTLSRAHGQAASGGFTLAPASQIHPMQRRSYEVPTEPGNPCTFWCQVMAWAFGGN